MIMDWEIVIGLETHAQLSTRSKIFSGASTAFGSPPNTQACAVDIALPGVLPVLNIDAVGKAIRFGIAVGATVNRRSVFARKNYFYPDLPKGYQISQYETPVVEGGQVAIQLDGVEKIIHLTRAHLEEDAGKSLHEDFHGMTGIDLNRAGTPLLEIVTEPDMRSAEEAVEYAKTLHALVRWIDICDGNMQEGSFRCDANVSVRKRGSDQLGTRREIKNLNSFRFLQQAIEYEARWQIEHLEEGGKIQQATVLFDPDSGQTRLMRTKEDAHDYRYFPDPDLLPLEIDDAWLERTREDMPELPAVRRQRYQNELGLSAQDTVLLVSDRETADYFEATLAAISTGDRAAAAKLTANWINGELAAALNRAELELPASPVSASALAGLISRVIDKTLSSKLAKEVFDGLWSGAGSADEIIDKRGLRQISDSGAIEKLVDEVIGANEQQVADYLGGKQKAFNSLVGQVMKASKGKANPAQVNEILKQKLDKR
ncbi:MAG TPA: Asp-tRNA(Asn)/Glu-tRNA(Gln) amidotransferase subunit GatB [Burkholderiales bacterium]|nr:Asp-tRNA(Asn)/Glu-tRNA(Gln) amidotransferase subunit GatB [Burkholderiales bacterium]